ncbi:FAD binding domain protein [Metarhizium album ARSEF 1941]|uniref:FAD binding domain protein n=1 Tax=Metarhizium album (strain ARSEF 1941) TaxID=1081103 RepID=A0A0B2WIM3_METAS|nr:FAD binding domain protein [Metarhizium album ARSEF 1941]KHN93703.1 FAD binding domain protein [Metarhizium album ARSEF 1941]
MANYHTTPLESTTPDEFELRGSEDSIRRSLKACDWSKKKTQRNRQTADSTGRYWAAQLVNDASVVVTPASSEDVSLAVQATMKTPLGRDYAFVSGGHSLTGASSSRGLVIDLKRLNHTTVLHNFTDPMTQRGITVVMYEGGVTSFGLQSAVNGTGWTAVTPRASSVGMGGG